MIPSQMLKGVLEGSVLAIISRLAAAVQGLLDDKGGSDDEQTDESTAR